MPQSTINPNLEKAIKKLEDELAGVLEHIEYLERRRPCKYDRDTKVVFRHG